MIKYMGRLRVLNILIHKLIKSGMLKDDVFLEIDPRVRQ